MRSNDEIVQIIKFESNKKGYTSTELAKHVGMAKSGISMIFNKTRQFPVNKVSDFAKALDVTPEYILGFDLQGSETEGPTPSSRHRALMKFAGDLIRDGSPEAKMKLATMGKMRDLKDERWTAINDMIDAYLLMDAKKETSD